MKIIKLVKNISDKKFKNKIILLMIISLLASLSHGISMYAGEWQVSPIGLLMYLGDNGKYAINEWRWIDSDYDSIAECYRFNEYGYLIASAYAPDGRYVNINGQWEEKGEVKQIYFSSFKPVVNHIKNLSVEPDVFTGSETRRINSTSKNLDNSTSKKKNSKKKTQYAAPKIGSISTTEEGYIINASFMRPVVDAVTGNIIRSNSNNSTNPDEDDPNYNRSIPGVDFSKKVSASKNYTRNMETAKIWGGDVWEHCMCLAGNEAYLKVPLEGMNYMRVEVAHQTHGTSTAETNCYLELWIDDEFIDSYDSFVDGEPLVIEEWFDDGEKTFELHWIVESGSKGRKLYLRDGRLRKFKYND